jgi:hypothetical protein
MERRHAITLILIFLVFGLLIHGFKALRKAHFSGGDRAAIALSDIDDTPYHVSSDEMESDRKRSQGRGRGLHLAGAVSKFNQYDFSGGKVIAADAKAKEEVKKKKKKTDKDKDAKTTDVADIRPYYNPNTNSQTTNNTNPNPNVVGTVQEEPKAAAPAEGIGAAANKSNSYQEWAALILGTPSATNVNNFVTAYKAHEVTSQVFYQILDAMIAEQNTQQQQLAVTAASDVPSAQSFEFLVQVTKLQGTTASQQASTALSGYSALNEVTALQIVMSTYTDATTIQDATTVLLNSADTYISNRTPTATTGTTTNLSSVYAGFVPLLNHIITVYASNANIESAAKSALSLISQVVVTQ